MSEVKSRPALFNHCVEVYNAMDDVAEDLEVDEVVRRVYQGFLTKLFKDLMLPVPYYTHVMSELTSMDCVRQLRRGGGNAPSQWVMLQPPTAELFDSKRMDFGTRTQKRRSSQEATDQRMRDLHRRVEQLEAWKEEMESA